MTPGVRVSAVTALVVILSGSAMVAAQQPTTPPAFDVISIKPNRSGDSISAFRIMPGGRFVATNATLNALIRSTYQFELEEFQIVRGPGWFDTERFDVDARTNAPMPPQEVATTLVRSLLASRFGLITHRERREMPIFALTVARADGRLGDGLRASAGSCTPGQSPGTGDRRCGVRIDDDAAGALHLDGYDTTIEVVATRLQFYVKRHVVDETGLSGRFDLHAVFQRPVTPSATVDRRASDAPSLERALADQLGLKLDSKQGPVDMLIIDSARRPDAN